MNKNITSITAILLIGTSVINFGAAGINSMTLSDIPKVYAKETDTIDTSPEMIPFGDDAYYTITDNGSTMTISGKGDAYYIPYDGRNIQKLIVENGITSISVDEFLQYENLESISLPDSVKYISDGIFDNTAWYKNQPDGLVYVGKIAYKYKGEMKEKTELTFKEGTTAIADKAFYKCSEIKSVTFPDSITSIPYMSFAECQNLSSVTIPDSVTNIGPDAFWGCYSLEKIIIPDSVTYIGTSAFADCFMLKDISIPDSIEFMGHYAFYQTSWYSNQPDGIVYAGKTAYGYKGVMDEDTNLEIKEGTKSIADSAFENCADIKTVNIPDSVTNTGCSIFKDCVCLENVTFSNNMTSINAASFWNCSNLKSITIPENIKNIGDSAFFLNHKLESVTFLSEELEIGYNAFSDIPNLRDVFYVGSEEDWKQKVSIDLDNLWLTWAETHFNYSPSSDQTNNDNHNILYGDINGDDIIDIIDLIELSRFLLGDTVLKGKTLTAADVSGDGIVDIVDLAVLKQFICKDDIKLGPKG